MKIKCDYCGSFISDTDEKCPNCGGVNSHLVRRAVGVPKTIEELKTWCTEKNIPLKDARFFIGEDYRGARAFGIYYDEKTENYVVYKNKSDGSRAVRYEGKDEAYAVNELYQKLKEEILNQKQRISAQKQSGRPSGNAVRGKQNEIKTKISKALYITGIALIILVFLFGIFAPSVPDRGYYNYENETYYYQPGDGWYTYNGGGWNSTTVDSTLYDNYSDYYDSSSYSSDYDTTDFVDSGYYEESSNNSYDSDWDSNDSWDSSDSWDSGGSDWDSDW
ncbi:MAG: zinc ribbon domain-containing protein [bacterium]|nr:zinc ribbon domain-containing protein [bacterium]